MSFSISQLLKASHLTRSGRLLDATRLIQRVLGSAAASTPEASARGAAHASPRAFNPSDGPDAANSVVDVSFRDLPAEPANETHFRASPDDSEAPPAGRADDLDTPVGAAPESMPDAAPLAPPSQATDLDSPPAQAAPQARLKPASFRAYRFEFEATDYAYRLYLPPGLATAAASGAAAMPAAAAGQAPALIVLLHGCKQDAADFAKGTGMNTLAGSENCLVLYPEQLAKSNSMRCWNWFDPAHQSRESGEPGMIAALTRQVIAQHGVDASRVYVAGLSAGGAMAAVLASEYPDLFAAAGIHSGLPQGAARDVMSAFSAMRRGPASNGADLKSASSRVTSDDANSPVPVIVFHGSADTTVNPDNGEHIVELALRAFAASELPLSENRVELPDASDTSSSAGQNRRGGSGRNAARSIYSAADGTVYVESWEIEAGPHAWSGGDAGGSYTDPDGPSASAAMLAFFLQHRRILH